MGGQCPNKVYVTIDEYCLEFTIIYVVELHHKHAIIIPQPILFMFCWNFERTSNAKTEMVKVEECMILPSESVRH